MLPETGDSAKLCQRQVTLLVLTRNRCLCKVWSETGDSAKFGLRLVTKDRVKAQSVEGGFRQVTRPV